MRRESSRPQHRQSWEFSGLFITWVRDSWVEQVRRKTRCLNKDPRVCRILSFIGTGSKVPTITAELMSLQILFFQQSSSHKRSLESPAVLFCLFWCSSICQRFRQPLSDTELNSQESRGRGGLASWGPSPWGGNRGRRSRPLPQCAGGSQDRFSDGKARAALDGGCSASRGGLSPKSGSGNKQIRALSQGTFSPGSEARPFQGKTLNVQTSEGGPSVPPSPGLPGPLSGTHGLRAHAPHVDTDSPVCQTRGNLCNYTHYVS